MSDDDHTKLALALHRLSYLEKGHEANRAEIEELKRKLSYYDRMSLKWGSFCFGALAFGALLAMGVDKAKDKIISWFLP